MRYFVSNIFLCSLCLMGLNTVEADTRDVIPIGGVLTDRSGQPIDEPVSVTFSFFDSETGGEPMWQDVYQLDVENGVFMVYLGEKDKNSIDILDFVDTDELWLGIKIEDYPEEERVRVGTVPYAIEAQYCRAVDARCPDSEFLQGWDLDTGEAVCSAVSIRFNDLGGVPQGLANGDQNTEYSSGDGLLLDTTTFSVDRQAIEEWARGVCLDPDDAVAFLDDYFVHEGETLAVTNEMLGGSISPEKIAGTAWTSTNDGVDSGLVADKLDGFDASHFSIDGHQHDDVHQGKYKRTVVVSPVGDGADTVANGDGLLAALNSINDASSTKPYLFKIEPGVYKLLTTGGLQNSLVMKSFVDVEGSGQNVTKVTSIGTNAKHTGTIFMVSNSALSRLTVENTGGEGYSHSIAVYANNKGGSNSTIDRVTMLTSNATDCRSFYSFYGVTKIVNSRIEARCHGYSHPFWLHGAETQIDTIETLGHSNYASGASGGRVSGGHALIHNLVARAESVGSADAWGMYIENTATDDGTASLEIYNSTVSAKGGNIPKGIRINLSGPGYDMALAIENSSIISRDGITKSYGIDEYVVSSARENPASFDFRAFSTKFEIEGPLLASNDGYTTRFINSILHAEDFLMWGGTAICAGVTDENDQFHASVCP